MAQVYLSLGSNIEQEVNIRSCLSALQNHFGELLLSSVYESEAVGFAGDNFYNAVVKISTNLSVGHLLDVLRTIEDDHGRIRKCERFSARTLDIDILIYDDYIGLVDGVELPRDEILKNAFVLWPLAEIAPLLHHPISQKTYAQHWLEFDKKSQRLWPVKCF